MSLFASATICGLPTAAWLPSLLQQCAAGCWLDCFYQRSGCCPLCGQQRAQCRRLLPHARRCGALSLQHLQPCMPVCSWASDMGVLPLCLVHSEQALVPLCCCAAPEQVLGQRCTLTADIYSLGILLVELTTQQAVTRRGGWRLPLAPQECSPAVLALIERCTAADPLAAPPATQVLQQLQEDVG